MTFLILSSIRDRRTCSVIGVSILDAALLEELDGLFDEFEIGMD